MKLFTLLPFIFLIGCASNTITHQNSLYASNKYEIDNLFTSTTLSIEEKISNINRFVNAKIRYNDDIKIWSEKDYWATPKETLSKLTGDCEDYAILKYFTLLENGIDSTKLRFIYAQNNKSNIAHMVLGFYNTDNTDPIILDNNTKYLKKMSDIDELTFIYSFNDFGMWLIQDNKSKFISTKIINLWSDLKSRHVDSKI